MLIHFFVDRVEFALDQQKVKSIPLLSIIRSRESLTEQSRCICFDSSSASDPAESMGLCNECPSSTLDEE